MAVAERWTVPFISTKGVKYEVDIYDTYTGTKPSTWPVTLQAGATPFVTTEDSSDDFFSPVRGSTGTLTVIDTDGTLFEQIVPATNTSRKVVLYKVTWDEQGEEWEYTIQWQGFLSCEAYSQDYTATAQELSLSVNSVLEAMDSVTLDSTAAEFCPVREAIAMVLRKMTTVMGGNCYGSIYYSWASKAFLNNYIDTTILFDKYEQSNEEYTKYSYYSKSCKEILSILCTYMGWTVRESLNNLYFERLGEEKGMKYQAYSVFVAGGSNENTSNKSTSQMSALTYRGIDHQKSITQGAKTVAIAANVKKYELNLDMPICPLGTATSYPLQTTSSGDGKYFYFKTPSSQSVSNAVGLRYGMIQMANNVVSFVSGGTFANTFSHSWAYSGSDHTYSSESERTNFNKYVGAFMTRTQMSSNGASDNLEPAIYISGIGREYSEDEGEYTLSLSSSTRLFSIRSVEYFSTDVGWIRIYAEGRAFNILDGQYQSSTQYTNNNLAFYLYCTLKWGSKYWNGSAWQSSYTTFKVRFLNGEIVTNYDSQETEHDDGLFIPITARNSGEVEFQIHYVVEGGTTEAQAEMAPTEECVLTKFEITYEYEDDVTKTDRDANHYFGSTGVNFADEVSVSTELATDMNNLPAASLIRSASDSSKYATEIEYTKTDGTTENRRPEHDLLDRMVSYYGAARRKVELEVEHPTIGLQTTTITGYDGKSYAPLAEERDWQTDTSKLTCFETI